MHKIIIKLFTNKQPEQLDRFTCILILLLFYFVASILIAMGFILKFDFTRHGSSLDKSSLGTFGDFFGGVVNPILTFFTVAGLAITIIMQRVALLSTGIQRFETTFFNMLTLHNNIVQQLNFNPSVIPDRVGIGRMLLHAGMVQRPRPDDIEGRGVFAAILIALKVGIDSDHDIVGVYKGDLQDGHNYVLGHYFRNLYQILHLINRQDGVLLSESQAREYASIIRAQLSAHELAILFLNCQKDVVDHGRFRDLLRQYRMLEHLPLNYDEKTQELRASNFEAATEYLEYYFLPETVDVRQVKVQVIGSGAYGQNPSVSKYLGSPY